MESIEKEVLQLKNQENQILHRLKADEAREDAIEALEKEILADVSPPEKSEVKRFNFADFGHAAVGAAVFASPIFFTPYTFTVVRALTLEKILLAHIIFLGCVLITINYIYRKDFSFDSIFLTELIRRVFYMYLSVTFIIVLMLWTFDEINATIPLYDLLRNVIAGNSIGMVGAITFNSIMR